MGKWAAACYTYAVADKDQQKKNLEAEGPIGQTIQLVKDYARQEIQGPLKGAGRWIGLGVAGAMCIGIATAFLALGVLRMVQTEWPGTFHGRWMSLLPYGIGLVACLFVAGVAFSRINKQPLNKEQR